MNVQTANPSIFYVEDSSDDVFLTEMAFRKAGVKVPLDVANSGEEAIARLQKYDQANPPVCILLDIKLPGTTGLEVLAWVRKQPSLRLVPVVMLTSSLLPADINQAYQLGANSYLVKPATLDELIKLACLIGQYWLACNTSPVAPFGELGARR